MSLDKKDNFVKQISHLSKGRGCSSLSGMLITVFLLQLAKMLKYSGYKRSCEICLGVFIIVWILSRLMYYPMV